MFYTSPTFTACNYPRKEADVVFLGIPFASTNVSKAARYGPLMVRESLKLVEDFVDGKNVFEKLKICDLGDLEIVPGSFELTSERLRDTVKSIKQENPDAFLVFIGGEHLVTLPIAESIKPKTIVQIDAHADLRKDYLGNEYMHQTWAYHASKISRIIQIGVVSWNKEELDVKEKKGIISCSADEFLNEEIKLEDPVHLTVDIDVLENVETGLPEGSMKFETLIHLLEKIQCSSMDIVEIADDKLPSATGFKAAHIIMKVLSRRVF